MIAGGFGDFDIKSLLNFDPPSYRCKACLGILNFHDIFLRGASEPRCPVCAALYIPMEDYTHRQIWPYMESQGLFIRYENVIEHARMLALIADCHPPLTTLLKALTQAKHFVHFVTFGMSHILVGVLKMTAVRVPVCGIVSNVDEGLADELTGHRDEAPNLNVKVFVKGFERNAPPDDWSRIPHQKLVVVDGLLAFKGSANLTVSAWRKAAEGRDAIELVTNVREVKDLNNRYFSPVWHEIGGSVSQINVTLKRS
ncbi:MAG TPA: hypothetical protein VKT83_17990 [bacterium]|nr:hypothetical protein [bacterium]